MTATFTDEQQKKHREQFIHECRQKAWGAACHAEWVSKGIDSIGADYKKLEDEDRAIQDEIKKLETALDHHTVENRAKRKTLQGRSNSIAGALKALAENMQQGQQALNGLYASVEASLALSRHAETWGWKEVATEK